MADDKPNQGPVTSAIHHELDRHLQERGMPTPEWWDEADRSFSKLCGILRPKTQDVLGELDDNADEYAIGARVARESSLPSITLLPSGSYAQRLTVTSEPLECMVFGTMGSKLYFELFWESIVSSQQDGTIAVHEVHQWGLVPMILLSLDLHIFKLEYIQCESLVRSYPVIIDAPAQFLRDRNNCSQIVQDTVEDLQESTRIQSLDESHRKSYYYIRAWSVANGLFSTQPGLNYRDIIRICELPQSPGSFSSIVSKFFEHYNSEFGARLSYLCATENDWEKLLSQIEKVPFHEKMSFPYYIRVSMMYTGSSKTKGGQWLLMVERRLVKLKGLLQERITKVQTRIWPQRLVSSKTCPGDDIYEGCFILGIRPENNEDNMPIAREVADRWGVQVQGDDLTVDNECFINVTMCEGSSDFAKEDLGSCTRTWPQPIVKSDDTHRTQDSDADRPEKTRKSKGVQKAQQKVDDSQNAEAGSTKGARLRQASDVLNRLRYDRDYNIDECVVGYRDRHTARIIEKPVADWSRETTDEEFIPEHRIEYFKMKDEVLWEKSSKLDKVFNSGRLGVR